MTMNHKSKRSDYIWVHKRNFSEQTRAAGPCRPGAVNGLVWGTFLAPPGKIHWEMLQETIDESMINGD